MLGPFARRRRAGLGQSDLDTELLDSVPNLTVDSGSSSSGSTSYDFPSQATQQAAITALNGDSGTVATLVVLGASDEQLQGVADGTTDPVNLMSQLTGTLPSPGQPSVPINAPQSSVSDELLGGVGSVADTASNVASAASTALSSLSTWLNQYGPWILGGAALLVGGILLVDAAR